ncbi:hypothetical protein R1flu_003480 [Riccia fluitans]|uniref:Uncharacterized protein n=1 Tax=Riccia fluitans TaxID=41844 RepID=A0ABD1Y991_9MARC
MGNVSGKKKRKGKGKGDDHYVVPFSTSNSNYLQVELPREIAEDLERPRPSPATGAKDPAKEMYEKLKSQPAVMVPKPWSEMDQILSQIKSSAVAAAATPSPKTPSRVAGPKTPSKEKSPAEEEAAVIDLGELMDGLDGDPQRSVSREKPEELNIDPLEFIKTKPFNPRKVKTLEKTLTFSTIHTVKELNTAEAKPETIENVLKQRTSAGHYLRAHEMSSPARLSNELSRRSSELTRRSSEIVRRSTEIERHSNDFQRRSTEIGRRSNEFIRRPTDIGERSNEFQRRSSEEPRRSAELGATRPYSEITFYRPNVVRTLEY